MGYISKDIAVITEPKIITLSAAPNFVQFASKPAVKTFLEINVAVNITQAAADIPTATILRLTEPSGIVHAFHGSTDPDEVGGSVYFVAPTVSDTAENLRQVLIANRWIAANFKIILPAVWTGSALVNGTTLNIKSKGTGAAFNITIAAPNNTANVAYTITPVAAVSINNDSISGEDSTAEIELDVYTAPAVFLGEEDRPTTAAKIGTFAIPLQKTYAGQPLWFELNALNAQYGGFNLPPASGWFNTGTVRVYRFAAKVRGLNSFTFYQSSALFVLNGYGPASEDKDLTPYIYDNNVVKLLTNKPRTPYVKGQKEFLNFIFKDPTRGTGAEFTLQVAYRMYSTSDKFLGVVYSGAVLRSALSIVNTCVLNIDAALLAHPTAGIVRVSLARGTTYASESLEYTIRPDGLHDLTEFSFLNRLGGWDSFNFDSLGRNEIKPQQDTFNKTVTPEYKKGDSIETVYTVSLLSTYTVEGAPVSDEVAEWLKELAAARVVLDGGGNYVIKDDFTLTVSSTSRNMQIPTIKYRLSETYTND